MEKLLKFTSEKYSKTKDFYGGEWVLSNLQEKDTIMLYYLSHALKKYKTLSSSFMKLVVKPSAKMCQYNKKKITYEYRCEHLNKNTTNQTHIHYGQLMFILNIENIVLYFLLTLIKT